MMMKTQIIKINQDENLLENENVKILGVIFNNTNFNIIPFGLDINRLDWYLKTFEIVSLMKQSNKKFLSQRFALDSKKNL